MVVVPPTINNVLDCQVTLLESGYGEMSAGVSLSRPKFNPEMDKSSVFPVAGTLLGVQWERTGASKDIIRADVA
jgi:hypothetical protein